MNVIFVLWGKKYTAPELEILYNKIKQYKPEYNYYCFTDQDIKIDGLNIIPIPKDLYLQGVWNKLYMFSEQFPVSGKVWYFDIDIVVKDNPFLEKVEWDKLSLIYSSHKKIIPNSIGYDVNINSSVMTWDTKNKKIQEIWKRFVNSGYRDYFLRKYAGIDRYIVHEGFEDLLSFFPSDYTKSHKYDKDANAPIITYEELNFGLNYWKTN